MSADTGGAAEYVQGPWSSEPKRTMFEHAGFPCITKKVRAHWCGYVGVPPGHPWHGKSYDTDGWEWPDVHGGVTYGDHCDGDPEEGVCHVAKPGEPDDVWWIGFDCFHAGDFEPPTVKMHTLHPDLFPATPPSYEQYRDLAYVQAECRSLAEQAAAAMLTERARRTEGK